MEFDWGRWRTNPGRQMLEQTGRKLELEIAWIRKAKKPTHAISVDVLQINLQQCEATYH